MADKKKTPQAPGFKVTVNDAAKTKIIKDGKDITPKEDKKNAHK